MPGTFYTVASASDGAAGMWLRLATSASVRAALWYWGWFEVAASASPGHIGIVRSTGGTVTNQTPEKCDSDSRAADTVGATDSTVDPTTSGQPLISVGQDATVNIIANQREWHAHPRFPILIGTSAFLTGIRQPGQSRSAIFSEPSACPIRAIRRRGRVRGYWHARDQSLRTSNPTTNPVQVGGSEFTMLQAETWPESFVPPYSAALFPAGAPLVDQAVGSVTRWQVYPQNFAPILAQMALWRAFDAPVSDNAVGSVNPRTPAGVTRVVYPFASGDNPTDLPVASVSTHWPYPITLRTSPGASEPKVARDQAVGSVNRSWSFVSWFKGLFGAPADKFVVVIPPDGSVGGSNRAWSYAQQFRQPPQAMEPTAAKDVALGSASVNPARIYPQNFAPVVNLALRMGSGIKKAAVAVGKAIVQRLQIS